ncbi:Ribonuclease H-like domain [Cinara cedri]|uniref:Ribonuclease H-like domain n=1 Tax=Cinara cedri TaxID=506608 RepID=A0A5E4MZR7_9HEMI|nr:Ribonuclease H-like domain [Cinara cedri]
MGIKDDFIFTQDNDSKHTAKKVKAWLSNNITEYLTNLAASAEKKGIKDDFIFTQDNDLKHTAKKVKAWLSNNITEYLVTPPQSPDINPIENLWDYLDRKIRDYNISSKETLKKTLEEEWNKITAETTRHLVYSMSKRLEAIIRFKGYPTKY